MARDPRTEQFLQAEAVDFDFRKDVPIEDFDIVSSLRNQARLGPAIDKDRVTEYALAMLDGIDFPAVVSYKAPNGKFVLVTGNHRLHAALESEKKTFDTYVVKTEDPMLLDRMTRSINSIEGVRPTRKEAVAQAVYLVERRHLTAKAAAQEFHLPLEVVQRAMRTAATRQRLGRLGESPETLPETSLAMLNAVRNDNVLKPLAELIRQASLPIPTVQALVQEVKDEPTEAGQLRIVQSWRGRADVKDRIGKYKGGTVKKPLRGADMETKLLGLFGVLANAVANKRNLEDLGITSPKSQERVKQAWLEAKAVVQAVLK